MGNPLEFEVVATGLHFPEGPVAMPDGSVVLVEIARARLTRVRPDGSTDLVAETGGGPNGAAVGPDGAMWLCNNGGFFTWHQVSAELLVPGETPDTWQGGSLQRVHLGSGAVEEVVTECAGRRLRAPNDLVFDRDGGLWFTDHGVTAEEASDQAGVLYRVAERRGHARRLRRRGDQRHRPVARRRPPLRRGDPHRSRSGRGRWSAPARWPPIRRARPRTAGTLLYDAPEGHLFDSLAVDGDGWVCVATLGQGGITCVAPDGSTAEHLTAPGPVGHQHLLRRRRRAHGLHHLLRPR